MKSICLLGASGSIGEQTIDVINQYKDEFTLKAFSVGNRTEMIIPTLAKHKNVTHVYLKDIDEANKLQKMYPSIKFYSGDTKYLNNLILESDVDMVVNALVGFVGLLPSLTSLKANKLLALANKESLVVGGDLINSLLSAGKGKLYPIDSEHSAIWKCLKVDDTNVDKIILTASGGSFRKLSRDELKGVTKEDALKHPTWSMGNKITIDSATMMNKGFELIEAYYLFGYKSEYLDVVLHDESMLHSMVKYKDGLIRGEINYPDMRNPIKFALFEGNIEFETQTFSSLNELKGLHFRDFIPTRYPLVGLAKEVIEKRGNLGAIINASNEAAVKAFLNDKLSFLGIEEMIFEAIKNVHYIANPTVEDLIKTHEETTEFVNKRIN